MRRVMSEDSVRRALSRIDEAAGVDWLQRHLDYTFRPLLGEPWILDVDTTVKPLYGRQEGAVVGYNPHQPGRPSHTYHSYVIAELRLILEVEVQAGNQHASKHSAPGLWALLARIGREAWPCLLRGDCDWGTEANMRQAEREELPYLFKLRLTRNAKRLIERTMVEPGWLDAGHGWQGKEQSLRLVGWSRHRRVILLRRPIERTVAVIDGDGSGRQLDLYFGEITADPAAKVFEYAVLVTSLPDEVLTVAQLYRDRAAGENNFDELKNHWGWGGFTTRDLQRCRLMARIRRADLQLVELVRAAGRSEPTHRGDHQPAAAAVRGRQTRHPEGGAHQSIGTPLIGMAQDGLAAFEPAFVDELAPLARESSLVTVIERPPGDARLARRRSRPPRASARRRAFRAVGRRHRPASSLPHRRGRDSRCGRRCVSRGSPVKLIGFFWVTMKSTEGETAWLIAATSGVPKGRRPPGGRSSPATARSPWSSRRPSPSAA